MTNIQSIPIQVVRGRTTSFTVSSTNSSVVWNTVGYVLRFMVKWRSEDADGSAVISLTNGSGITASSASFTVVIPEAAFSSIAYLPQTLKYEMTLWDGSKSQTLSMGDFIIEPNVVRTAN